MVSRARIVGALVNYTFHPDTICLTCLILVGTRGRFELQLVPIEVIRRPIDLKSSSHGHNSLGELLHGSINVYLGTPFYFSPRNPLKLFNLPVQAHRRIKRQVSIAGGNALRYHN
jgi:hypothetical protein